MVFMSFWRPNKQKRAGKVAVQKAPRNAKLGPCSQQTVYLELPGSVGKARDKAVGGTKGQKHTDDFVQADLVKDFCTPASRGEKKP